MSFLRSNSGMFDWLSQWPDLNTPDCTFHLLKTRLRAKSPETMAKIGTKKANSWKILHINWRGLSIPYICHFVLVSYKGCRSGQETTSFEVSHWLFQGWLKQSYFKLWRYLKYSKKENYSINKKFDIQTVWKTHLIFNPI